MVEEVRKITFAESGYARKAIAASTRNGAKGSSSSVLEEGRRAMEQRMKQRPLETVKGSEMERDFLLCEVGGHRKDTEEGQRPMQAKAPVQKRGAVTRVELAETQGCVLELRLD